MKPKTVIVVAILLLGAASTIFGHRASPPQASEGASKESRGMDGSDGPLGAGFSAARAGKPDESSLGARLTALLMPNFRDRQAAAAASRRDAGEAAEPRQGLRVDAWEVVDAPAPHLPLTPEERVDGRRFIKLNRDRIAALAAGDRLDLTVPQTMQHYSVEVVRVETHDDGNITWHGHLQNLPDDHTVSITQGPAHTFGAITTPNGHYTIEVHGKDGWVVASHTLFKTDPGKDDYLVPEGLGGDGDHKHD